MCAEQLTSDDRDLYRVECSGFAPLVERFLSWPTEGPGPQPLTRLLWRRGADEVAHFIS